MAEWETRQTLLQRAKDPDDHTAWTQFADYYYSFIEMILNKMNFPAQEHEDLIQEVLLKLWKSLPNHVYDQDRAKFRTWLGTVIRNCALNHIRTKQRAAVRQTELESSVDNLDWLQDSSLQHFEKQVEAEWVGHVTKLAMDRTEKKFTGKAMDVFRLSLEGMSVAEIAEKLELKEQTVSVLKSRVKSKLVTEIQQIRTDLEW